MGTAAACLCAACLSGCGKAVDLTFINLTDESLEVHVTSPAKGRQYLGVLPPMGKLRHELAIDRRDLPATCTWTAGPHTDSFRVAKDSEEDVWIDIHPLARPRTRIGRPSGID
jgi:hypothetical protein